MKTFLRTLISCFLIVALLFFWSEYKTNPAKADNVGINDLEEQLSTITEHLEQTTILVLEKNEKIEKLNAEIETAEIEIEELNSSISTLTEELDNTKLEKNELENQNELLKVERDSLIEELNLLKEDIDSNSEEIENLNIRLSNVESSIGGFETMISELEININTIETNITELQDDVDELIVWKAAIGLDLYNLYTDIDVLEDKISSIEEEIVLLENTVSLMKANSIYSYQFRENNSWVYFNNGLRIAWGHSKTTEKNVLYIDLPIEFSNSSYGLFFTPRTDLTSNTVWGVRQYSKTTSNFGVLGTYKSSSQNSYSAVEFDWFAIGF